MFAPKWKKQTQIWDYSAAPPAVRLLVLLLLFCHDAGLHCQLGSGVTVYSAWEHMPEPFNVLITAPPSSGSCYPPSLSCVTRAPLRGPRAMKMFGICCGDHYNSFLLNASPIRVQPAGLLQDLVLSHCLFGKSKGFSESMTLMQMSERKWWDEDALVSRISCLWSTHAAYLFVGNLIYVLLCVMKVMFVCAGQFGYAPLQQGVKFEEVSAKPPLLKINCLNCDSTPQWLRQNVNQCHQLGNPSS